MMLWIRIRLEAKVGPFSGLNETFECSETLVFNLHEKTVSAVYPEIYTFTGALFGARGFAY